MTAQTEKVPERCATTSSGFGPHPPKEGRSAMNDTPSHPRWCSSSWRCVPSTVTAVRAMFGAALVFTVAAGIHGYQPGAVDTAPVLVGCADGPTCTVPVTTGPIRTVNILWIQHPVVPAVQQPIGPDPGADL